MNRTRWRLLVACLAVIGAAIAVAGGSAGNREGDVTFEALPGPGAVSYGENIAYRSTFDNTNRFRLHADPVRPDAAGRDVGRRRLHRGDCKDVLRRDGVVDRHEERRGSDERRVRLQRSAAAPARGRPRWSSSSGASRRASHPPRDAIRCLKTEASWLIKERKSTNGNETFPKERPDRGLGAAAREPRESNETLRAGGYELGACSGNSKSLSTNQAISLGNPVTSSFCLPPFATSGVNVGIATSITELDGNARQIRGLHRSARRHLPRRGCDGLRPGDGARSSSGCGTPRCRPATRSRRSSTTAQPLPRCDSPEAATSAKDASSTSSRRRATRRSGRSSSRRRRTGPSTW